MDLESCFVSSLIHLQYEVSEIALGLSQIEFQTCLKSTQQMNLLTYKFMICTNSEKTKTWTNLDVLTKSIDMNNSEAKNIKTY